MATVNAIVRNIYNTIEFITDSVTKAELFPDEFPEKELMKALAKLEETIFMIDSAENPLENSKSLGFKSAIRELIYMTEELSNAWKN